MKCAPRIEIDLSKIFHNALTLVRALADLGISVTGVSKATLGSTEIARLWLKAGVSGIGDSRIENIEAMRMAQLLCRTTRRVFSLLGHFLEELVEEDSNDYVEKNAPGNQHVGHKEYHRPA